MIAGVAVGFYLGGVLGMSRSARTPRWTSSVNASMAEAYCTLTAVPLVTDVGTLA